MGFHEGGFTPFEFPVDKLIKLVADGLGMSHPEIAETVRIVDAKLAANETAAG